MSHKKHPQSQRTNATQPATPPTLPLPKRGSAIVVLIFGCCLLIAGLYLGGWFNLVKPEQMQQCQASVQQLYPKPEDQQVLLPLCRDRHMVEGIASTNKERLTVAQIQHSLDVGKRIDMVAMFIGGAFIGGAIAAFAAAHRIYKRKRGIADDEE